MYNILVCDDEVNICELIKKYARYDGHLVDTCHNGIDAIEKIKNNNYDIAIMDVMMPELDGFSAVKRIREFSNIPIIMLSARGEEYDKLYGFDLGVDDYVVKPFSPKELLLRVNAVMKRSTRTSSPVLPIYEYKTLKIDRNARLIYINQRRIDVTPKEYGVLLYLIDHENMAVTRKQLLDKVWGYENIYVDDRTIDTHMKLLRKKIEPYGNNIITLRGVGYRFETNEK